MAVDGFIEHDWLSFPAGGSEPYTSGYGPAPWSDDLLISANEDQPVLRPFAVGRHVGTRAHIHLAWTWALFEGLSPRLSETGIREAIAWAFTTSCPRSYAAALVTVFNERYDRRAILRDTSAITWLGLVRRCMRDLGDPQGLPYEDSDD
jgi:hypothetical protein